LPVTGDQRAFGLKKPIYQINKIMNPNFVDLSTWPEEILNPERKLPFPWDGTFEEWDKELKSTAITEDPQ